jgi:hypothetical protein
MAEARPVLGLPVFSTVFGTAGLQMMFGTKAFYVGPSAYFGFSTSNRYAFGLSGLWFLNGKPFTTTFLAAPEVYYGSISSSLGTCISALAGFGSMVALGKRFGLVALIKAGYAVRTSGTGLVLDLFSPFGGGGLFFNFDFKLAIQL